MPSCSMDQVRADFAALGAAAGFGCGVEENFRCVREPNGCARAHAEDLADVKGGGAALESRPAELEKSAQRGRLAQQH